MKYHFNLLSLYLEDINYTTNFTNFNLFNNK